MSIKSYHQTQNTTDTPIQLTIRAVRSILLYCIDQSEKGMSKHQKQQSAEAGYLLCDFMIEHMRNDLPEVEQVALMAIFQQISSDLYKCYCGQRISLTEHEWALKNLLKILENK